MCGGAWCLGELCVPEDGSVCPGGGSVSWGFCVLGAAVCGYLWAVGGLCPCGASLSEEMEGRGWEGLYVHIQSTLEQRRD